MDDFGHGPWSRVALGAPRTHQLLTVVPLLAHEPQPSGCLLFDDALERGLVEVTESGAGGEVPRLAISNRAAEPVLVLEGQALEGGMQERVVNASILVPARQDMLLPVSCVERGRWSRRSRAFASGTLSAPSLRATLRASVSRSRAAGGSFDSDQGAVWDAVDHDLERAGAVSSTSAGSAAHAALAADLGSYAEALPEEPGQVGMVACVAGRPVALELFADPLAYARMRRKLIAACAFAALFDPPPPGGLGDVESLRRAIDRLELERSPSAGLGTDCRAETAELSLAALELDGVYVHASALVVHGAGAPAAQ